MVLNRVENGRSNLWMVAKQDTWIVIKYTSDIRLRACTCGKYKYVVVNVSRKRWIPQVT